MPSTKDILLERLRAGGTLEMSEQLRLTFTLAVPAIFAQLSMCLMSYIDAAMVGRLGSGPAAAIGLVSSTCWIFGSMCYGNTSGFSVQIAHRCGARDFKGAQKVFRKGLATVIGAGLLLAILGYSIGDALPSWLGGSSDIAADATAYFRIYTLFLPVMQISIFAELSLIASGNLKVPSLVSLAMCVLDVVFNYVFIFVFSMGAAGAALGTGVAELVSGAFLLIYALGHSNELKQSIDWLQPMRRFIGTRSPQIETARAESFSEAAEQEDSTVEIVRNALKISWPLWLQNLVTRGAYIAATVLIAPLGTIAIAANSFAIIAEGFCYLPGYGMQDAASTLVGQSLGAGRKDMARKFAAVTIASGAAMMTVLAVFMWTFATPIMGLLSNDAAVIELGARCLRIEAWAELLYGVSIVANGCCTGAGDTLVPSFINLLSMWVIRISLALLLIPRYGLEGYWFAMATELSVKGIIFALRIRGSRWLSHKFTGRTKEASAV